jgi:hypothetical protein
MAGTGVRPSSTSRKCQCCGWPLWSCDCPFDIDPLDIDPFDMEPLDIAPELALPCFFVGFLAIGAVVWPFDIEPCDVDPEVIAPLDTDPDDIDPELMAPPCTEPAWLPDMEPVDIVPLLWVCAWPVVPATTQKTMPSPAFLA